MVVDWVLDLKKILKLELSIIIISGIYESEYILNQLFAKTSLVASCDLKHLITFIFLVLFTCITDFLFIFPLKYFKLFRVNILSQYPILSISSNNITFHIWFREFEFVNCYFPLSLSYRAIIILLCTCYEVTEICCYFCIKDSKTFLNVYT